MCAAARDFPGLTELKTPVPGVEVFYSDVYAKESAENVGGIVYSLIGHADHLYPKRPEFSILVLTEKDWKAYVKSDHLYGEIFYENSCIYCANVFSYLIPTERETPFVKENEWCAPRWWNGVSFEPDVNEKLYPWQERLEKWKEREKVGRWLTLSFYYEWSLIGEIIKLFIDANFHFEKRWMRDLVVDFETYLHLAVYEPYHAPSAAEVYESWADQLIEHGKNHARYRTLAAFEDIGRKLNPWNMAWYQGRIRKAAIYLYKKYRVDFLFVVLENCSLPLQKMVNLLGEQFNGFDQWFSNWEPLAFLKDEEKIDDKPLLPLSVWKALKAGYSSEDYGRLELWIRNRGTAPPDEHSLHRCPLCGYEVFTNDPVHPCPLAPLRHEEERSKLSTPSESIGANIMDVPMYLLENEKGELICKEKDILLGYTPNPSYRVFRWEEIRSAVLGQNITEEDWDDLCLSTLNLMNKMCEKFPISFVTLAPNWRGVFTRPKAPAP